MITYLHALLSKRLDERGASAVEYGLLVAGIAVVIIAAVFLLGGTVSSLFGHTQSCIGNGAAGAAGC